MNTVGEPCEGKPHARFDEGRLGRFAEPVAYSTTAPEGNVYALVGKAITTLEHAGQPVQATALREWFRAVPPLGGVSYDDVRRMVEQYCEVTWVNEKRSIKVE